MSSFHSKNMFPLISKPISTLSGDVVVPGDKSISHRSLILSALSVGQTKVNGLLESEDVLALVKVLQKLGVEIYQDKGSWIINGLGVGGLLSPDGILDFGNSGTAARLMMGVFATHDITAKVTGDASLCSRPMGRVVDPLQLMGAEFSSENKMFPMEIKGADTPVPIEYILPIPSAQVKSAILLAGLNCHGTTTVIEPIATRDHTERMLKYFGANINITEDLNNRRKIVLQGLSELRSPGEITIPADPSSSAFPMVAALITDDSDITISNVMMNVTRVGLIATLKEMGANISISNLREICGEEVADIRVKSSRLHGVEVPEERVPSMIDEFPILAIAAAFAKGKTKMSGLGELKVKESDRLAAIYNGLIKCGVKAVVNGDSLEVFGGGAIGNSKPIETYMDHRIAMSFLVMGMGIGEPIIVDDGSMIATSFNNFIDLMNGIGANIEAYMS